MSTAVLEMTPKEQAAAELQQRIQDFVMPRPQKGISVLWYPHGSKSEEAEVGFVWKTGHRNIVVRLISGVVRETVRHIDDPKLQLGAGQRENGAWDFTDKDKADIERDKQIATLQSRLDAMEELFNEPKKKKSHE